MIGETFGGYTLLRRLGAGGMGEVYLARHRRLARKAAVKVLRPELSSNAGIVERFFNEARAASLIEHPGIVQVFDCDVHPTGRAFIVMEFLAGESLGACLARIGGFGDEPRIAAAIVGQVASAIGAAHKQAIIHRDLKPENLFLVAPGAYDSSLRVKVLDFGIAKLAAEGVATSRTQTGSLLGTPLYMSPEQCRGAGAIDHRSDIYSLGCIAFELLCGRPPFVCEGAGELLVAHLSNVAPRSSVYVPSVPPDLDALVASMLEKDPAKRPQTMDEVLAALERVLGVPAAQFQSLVSPPRGFPSTSEDEGAAAPSPSAVPVAMSAAPPPSPAPAVPPSSPVGPAPAHPLHVHVQVEETLPLPPGGILPNLPPRPAVHKLPPGRTTLGDTASEIGRAAPAPRRRGLMVAVPLVVVALSLGAWGVLRTPTESSTAREPAAAPVRPSRPAAPVTPPAAAPAESPPQADITLDVRSAPKGLEVRVDGEVTQIPAKLPRREGAYRIQLTAPGHQARELEITGAEDHLVEASLERLPRATGAGDRSGRKKRPADGRQKKNKDRDAITTF